ncbi:MAG TPA: hypothetical protein VEY11_04690 [Pyrinomonadaceae bacterium]|nr:hypothetical protein [Pyrinomonadaceae bacterium]
MSMVEEVIPDQVLLTLLAEPNECRHETQEAQVPVSQFVEA